MTETTKQNSFTEKRSCKHLENGNCRRISQVADMFHEYVLKRDSGEVHTGKFMVHLNPYQL